MGAKVGAAADFVVDTGGSAAIGSLDRALDVVEGRSGTRIVPEAARRGGLIRARAPGDRPVPPRPRGSRNGTGAPSGADPLRVSLKSFDPPIEEAAGKRVVGLRRLGKRVVLALEDDLFLIVHLMISGRFQWKDPDAPIPRKMGHAAFDFDDGSLSPDRGVVPQACLASPGPRRGCPGPPRPGGCGASRGLPRDVRGSAPAGEPYAQEGPHRSASVVGHRERPLRRDPAAQPAFAGAAHGPAQRCGSGAALRGREELTSRMEQPSHRGGGRHVPEEGHRVPPGDGGPREVRGPVSPVRHSHPADRLRQAGDQLLSHLSDGGESCWRTVPSPASFERTGPARWRSWRP